MIEDVLSGAATHHVACERAESFIDRLPAGCVSLMTLDFPYFQVREEAWDNAWPTPEAFIAWMGEVLAKCRRVLALNGSIYVFAASQVRGGLTMATRVECEVARHFQIVNRITWRKNAGWHEKAEQEALRGFFPASEAIIFAEQCGADGIALGESQYGAKCDELRGFVFESLRAYLDGERARAGVTTTALHEAWCAARGTKGHMVGHWFGRSQWMLPTEANYQWLRQMLGDGFLRREYESLRREYDALRRPFNVSAAVPYTDVWTYETVNTYPGKHLCEKPETMARDVVRASSRPSDLVADFFCGSGAFLAAAVAEGRRAIGCDMDPHWAEQASRRCDAVKASGRIPRTAAPKKDERQLGLFKGAA